VHVDPDQAAAPPCPPAPADDAGAPAFTGPVGAAIRACAGAVATRAGISVEVVLGGHDGPGAHDDLVFRLAREFVTGSADHAGASQVRVVLDRDDQGTRLELQDDGVGLDARRAAIARHTGLAVAEERVARAGGSMAVTRPAHGGVRLVVELDGPAPQDDVPARTPEVPREARLT
jgi:two-component system NarL family sensor kinase